MNSVDKLRGYDLVDRGERLTAYLPSSDLADEIEAEIQRDYMLLPKDADGIPIHVGDTLESSEYPDDVFTCIGYSYLTKGTTNPRWSIAFKYIEERGETEFTSAKQCTHYHAPTIDDVLYTYGQSCIRAHEEAGSDDAKREMLASLRKEFEMKLREVMRDE